MFLQVVRTDWFVTSFVCVLNHEPRRAFLTFENWRVSRGQVAPLRQRAKRLGTRRPPVVSGSSPECLRVDPLHSLKAASLVPAPRACDLENVMPVWVDLSLSERRRTLLVLDC